MYITNISYDGVYHCYGELGVVDITSEEFNELKELWYDNNGGYVGRNGVKVWSFARLQYVEYGEGGLLL